VVSVYGIKTRVIEVTYESPPAPDLPRRPERIRLAVLVLYPLEVKRQLATVDNAKARAIQIARQILQKRLDRLPDLDALNCSAVVTGMTFTFHITL
jgi:hypothetical protein